MRNTKSTVIDNTIDLAALARVTGGRAVGQQDNGSAGAAGSVAGCGPNGCIQPFPFPRPFPNPFPLPRPSPLPFPRPFPRPLDSLFGGDGSRR